jgi:hypothetical protein
MNVIRKVGEDYILELENGQEVKCSRWYEKKVDKWHVVVPKEAREICGRTYIRESYFDNSDCYEFENKTEHRSGIGNGGWRTRLTTEELTELEEAEKTIERLKKIGMERTPEKVDPNSEEGIMLQIQKLMTKLEKVRS